MVHTSICHKKKGTAFETGLRGLLLPLKKLSSDFTLLFLDKFSDMIQRRCCILLLLRKDSLTPPRTVTFLLSFECKISNDFIECQYQTCPFLHTMAYLKPMNLSHLHTCTHACKRSHQRGSAEAAAINYIHRHFNVHETLYAMPCF